MWRERGGEREREGLEDVVFVRTVSKGKRTAIDGWMDVVARALFCSVLVGWLVGWLPSKIVEENA